MALTRVKGFNIILKLNDKKVVGTTSNSLGVKPKMKESLIKDDLGTSQSEQVGYDTDLSISGLVILDDAATPVQMQLDELMEAAIAGTVIPFVYNRTGSNVTWSGNLKITDYKEDSDSENIATYSVSCKVDGALTKGVLVP